MLSPSKKGESYEKKDRVNQSNQKALLFFSSVLKGIVLCIRRIEIYRENRNSTSRIRIKKAYHFLSLLSICVVVLSELYERIRVEEELSDGLNHERMKE